MKVQGLQLAQQCPVEHKTPCATGPLIEGLER